MKILIVNDYIDKIWWIETHIYDIKELLEKKWYKVKIIWFKWKNKFLRYVLYILSFFNIVGFIYFLYTLKKYKPDIIRFHSIWRAWWFLILLFIKNKKTIITYHDRWIFCPKASKLKDEKEIIKYKNFKNRIKDYKIFWLIKYIKNYILLFFIKKNIKIHIVPSEYMKNILQNYSINPIVLKHFIKCEK